MLIKRQVRSRCPTCDAMVVAVVCLADREIKAKLEGNETIEVIHLANGTAVPPFDHVWALSLEERETLRRAVVGAL